MWLRLWNRNYSDSQRRLASMMYNIFNKRAGGTINKKKRLIKELNKQVIRKFKKRKVEKDFIS